MIEGEGEHIPASAFVKYCLEERMSAIRERRHIPADVQSFDRFLATMMSDQLEMLYSQLDESQRRTAFDGIYSFSEYVARAANALANMFLRLQDAFLNNPEEFYPRRFDERLVDAYEAKKMIKTDFPSFASHYSKLKQDPIPGLFQTLETNIVERRILRRYIRTRFGIIWGKTKLHQKRAHRRQKKFDAWLRENEPDCTFSTEQIQAAFIKYNFSLNRDKHLCNYAQKRLSLLETEFTLWKSAIYMSFDALVLLHGAENFPLEEFAGDILRGIEPAIEGVPVGHEVAVIQTKKELSLDYDNELLNLSALIATKLSPSVNQNLANTLSVEPREFRDTLLEQVPGSVLIAMEDESDKRAKLHNKVANLICEELPSDCRHYARRRRQIRDSRKKGAGTDPIEVPILNKVVEPDDLLAIRERDFTLLEDARIDHARMVQKANLTINEKAVYSLKLQDYTEVEIAQKLNKKIGTVKSLYSRARTKIRQTQTK